MTSRLNSYIRMSRRRRERFGEERMTTPFNSTPFGHSFLFTPPTPRLHIHLHSRQYSFVLVLLLAVYVSSKKSDWKVLDDDDGVGSPPPPRLPSLSFWNFDGWPPFLTWKTMKLDFLIVDFLQFSFLSPSFPFSLSLFGPICPFLFHHRQSFLKSFAQPSWKMK